MTTRIGTKEPLILACPTEWSTRRICEACSCDKQTVLRVFKKHGMPRPRPITPSDRLQRREFEIRYGVDWRFWRRKAHTLQTMLACHETARDWYVRTYKERKENAL